TWFTWCAPTSPGRAAAVGGLHAAACTTGIPEGRAILDLVRKPRAGVAQAVVLRPVRQLLRATADRGVAMAQAVQRVVLEGLEIARLLLPRVQVARLVPGVLLVDQVAGAAAAGLVRADALEPAGQGAVGACDRQLAAPAA